MRKLSQKSSKVTLGSLAAKNRTFRAPYLVIYPVVRYTQIVFFKQNTSGVGCRRARGRQMKRGAGEERKESNRLNLEIFLVCAFLVALSI